MKTIYDSINISPYKNKIWEAYLKGLNIGIFDIETTGLNPLYSKVVVGGLLSLKEKPSYYQFFAENKDEEKKLLKAYKNTLSSFDVLISYNGERFDIPFLQERFKKHHLSYDFSNHWSVDLYRIIDKHSELRKALPNLKQKTIEEFLGISTNREDKISGKESIELYKEYLKTANQKTREKILLHNKDDLVQLASIIPIVDKLNLHKAFFYEGFAVSVENKKLINKDIKIKKDQLEIKATGVNIPSDFYAFKPSYHGIFKDGELFLTISTEQVKDADVFDLTALSEDYSLLRKLPAFQEDYLIIRNQGEFNYNEVNKLIGLIEIELLKEFA